MRSWCVSSIRINFWCLHSSNPKYRLRYFLIKYFNLTPLHITIPTDDCVGVFVDFRLLSSLISSRPTMFLFIVSFFTFQFNFQVVQNLSAKFEIPANLLKMCSNELSRKLKLGAFESLRHYKTLEDYCWKRILLSLFFFYENNLYYFNKLAKNHEEYLLIFQFLTLSRKYSFWLTK